MMNGFCRKVPAALVVAALFLIAAHAMRAQSAAASQSAAAQTATAAPVLVAKIEKTVTTKNAKVGDTLTAKTLKPAKTADGTDIPKGSRLIGKIAVVQSKQAGNGNSMLAFRFDQAEMKGGAAVPIKGYVIAIGPSLAPQASLGANSVMGRGGVGSTNGLDPSAGLGKPGALDETNIPKGSTLEGVALGVHKDADWTTALQGVKRDILLDSDVLVKVELR